MHRVFGKRATASLVKACRPLSDLVERLNQMLRRDRSIEARCFTVSVNTFDRGNAIPPLTRPFGDGEHRRGQEPICARVKTSSQDHLSAQACLARNRRKPSKHTEASRAPVLSAIPKSRWRNHQALKPTACAVAKIPFVAEEEVRHTGTFKVVRVLVAGVNEGEKWFAVNRRTSNSLFSVRADKISELRSRGGVAARNVRQILAAE